MQQTIENTFFLRIPCRISNKGTLVRAKVAITDELAIEARGHPIDCDSAVVMQPSYHLR
eukprot:m.1655025 g.1655025  ORF g.1655025 m.1655025 type:complete len:59 (-) comp102951_c0_seq1:24-200(-)